MKVKDASELTGVEVNRQSELKAPARASSPARTDKVSTPAKAQVEAAVAAAQAVVGNDHSAQLAAIEAAIRNGAFKPDPQRIAERILDDAELTAKLQALMKR